MQKQIRRVQELSQAIADNANMEVDKDLPGPNEGAIRTKTLDESTDLADAHDRSFNDDWLPTWKQLRSALVDEYAILQKEKKDFQQC